MRFSVPQFIDVEDKIFGQLTLKQAIYLAGGAGVIVTLFIRLGFMWSVLLGGPVGILAFALAFVKINNRPFYLVIYSAFFYSIHDKLYLWKKVPKKKEVVTQEPEKVEQPFVPKVSQSRLKELAWSLDTGGSMYTNEKQWKQ
ncbi:MAG: PrgI family protein [Candidatus Pacebacteria bacterium]|nr:PrgI family protein [Candidatus Paceibacterota bacterium]